MGEAKPQMKKIFWGGAAVSEYYEDEQGLHVVRTQAVGPFDTFLSLLLGSNVIADPQASAATAAADEIIIGAIRDLPSRPSAAPDFGHTPHIQTAHTEAAVAVTRDSAGLPEDPEQPPLPFDEEQSELPEPDEVGFGDAGVPLGDLPEMPTLDEESNEAGDLDEILRQYGVEDSQTEAPPSGDAEDTDEILRQYQSDDGSQEEPSSSAGATLVTEDEIPEQAVSAPQTPSELQLEQSEEDLLALYNVDAPAVAEPSTPPPKLVTPTAAKPAAKAVDSGLPPKVMARLDAIVAAQRGEYAKKIAAFDAEKMKTFYKALSRTIFCEEETQIKWLIKGFPKIAESVIRGCDASHRERMCLTAIVDSLSGTSK